MNIAFDAIEGVVRSLFFTSAERNRERDDGIESISIFPSTLADFVVQEPSSEETIPIEEVSTVDEGPLLPDFVSVSFFWVWVSTWELLAPADAGASNSPQNMISI